jgi:hypothetical protein
MLDLYPIIECRLCWDDEIQLILSDSMMARAENMDLVGKNTLVVGVGLDRIGRQLMANACTARQPSVKSAEMNLYDT